MVGNSSEDLKLMWLHFELLLKARISLTNFVITVLLLARLAGGGHRGDGDCMKLICLNEGKQGENGRMGEEGVQVRRRKDGRTNMAFRSSNTARGLETRSLFPIVGDIGRTAPNTREVRVQIRLQRLTKQRCPQNYRASRTMIGKWRHKPELRGFHLTLEVQSFRQSPGLV